MLKPILRLNSMNQMKPMLEEAVVNYLWHMGNCGHLRGGGKNVDPV